MVWSPYGRALRTEPSSFAEEDNPEMRAEISYDLVMDDDMEFVEGTYRLPGGDW